MFVSGALLWQVTDILSRPSWTSKDFRFQHFIDLFEKQEQKVIFLIELVSFLLISQGRILVFFMFFSYFFSRRTERGF
jgi:hypothetical protein